MTSSINLATIVLDSSRSCCLWTRSTRHAEPVFAADDTAEVALSSHIVEEIDAAGPEAARFTITGRDLHLSRQRHAEPMLWGRMPGCFPVCPDVQEGSSARRDGSPRLSRRSTRHDLHHFEGHVNVLKVRFAVRGRKYPRVLHSSSASQRLG